MTLLDGRLLHECFGGAFVKWRCCALEGLIKDIVDADKVARNRVNEKIHERDNVHSQLQEKREEILARFREDSKKQIEERRSQLESELKEAAALEETRYQNMLKQVENLYIRLMLRQNQG